MTYRCFVLVSQLLIFIVIEKCRFIRQIVYSIRKTKKDAGRIIKFNIYNLI